jgi:flagellin-specific chaperone FliS
MRALYDYFDRRLHDSNMTKTEPGITEVLKHVTVLRDAWAEMTQGGAGTDAEERAALPAPSTDSRSSP